MATGTSTDNPDDPREIPIFACKFGVRARKCFTKLGLTTLGQVRDQNPADLKSKCRGFGDQTLQETREILARHGLAFPGEDYTPPVKKLPDRPAEFVVQSSMTTQLYKTLQANTNIDVKSLQKISQIIRLAPLGSICVGDHAFVWSHGQSEIRVLVIDLRCVTGP